MPNESASTKKQGANYTIHADQHSYKILWHYLIYFWRYVMIYTINNILSINFWNSRRAITLSLLNESAIKPIGTKLRMQHFLQVSSLYTIYLRTYAINNILGVVFTTSSEITQLFTERIRKWNLSAAVHILTNLPIKLHDSISYAFGAIR